MNKSLTYDYVKNFIEIESNSGCKLLNDTYKNNHTKLKVVCECGNTFEVSFSNFKSQNIRRCNNCRNNYMSEKIGFLMKLCMNILITMVLFY